MEKYIIEICAGSVSDCITARSCGISRVELNSALFLGGLTPSIAMLDMVKERCPGLEVCTMVRPRGAGFCYSDTEYEQMLREAKELIAYRSDGIVFGILKEDFTIDKNRIKLLVDIAHDAGKKAIFHRAFDCSRNLDEAIESLIGLRVDRVLTSGGHADAYQGIESLAHLQNTYGGDIEILAGCGIRPSNAIEIIERTGIKQIHSSCGTWFNDVTTKNDKVSYGYNESTPCGYEGCSKELITELLKSVSRSNTQ